MRLPSGDIFTKFRAELRPRGAVSESVRTKREDPESGSTGGTQIQDVNHIHSDKTGQNP